MAALPFGHKPNEIIYYGFSSNVLEKMETHSENKIDQSIKQVILPIFAKKLAGQEIPGAKILILAKEAITECPKERGKNDPILLALMFMELAIQSAEEKMSRHIIHSLLPKKKNRDKQP